MRLYTKEELSLCDGKEGRQCLIAYKGLIYDVTGSFHWKNGVHWVTHKAGMDLTPEMNAAPHFDDVLKKFKVIGCMNQDLQDLNQD